MANQTMCLTRTKGLLSVFLLATRAVENYLCLHFAEASPMLAITFRITTFVYLVPALLAKCPVGTTQGPAGTQCFLYQTVASSWVMAEQDCVNRKGHLTSVHDSLTNTFVSNLARGCANEVWLGGESFVEKTWAWTDGTRWQYTHWPSGKYIC